MGELYDGVTWQNLLAFAAPVMGYTDGGYAWPPEAWQAFRNRGSIGISVTGDQGQPVHDCEFGAESPALSATAAANRVQNGLWAALYSSQDNLPNVTAALKGKGLYWRDASFWPAPGAYLHIADPSGNIKAGRWSPPVTPVAVQDVWAAGYDHSTTHGTYPLTTGGGDEMTDQDKQDIINGVALQLRELFAPPGELFGRGVQFVNEALKESGLTGHQG